MLEQSLTLPFSNQTKTEITAGGIAAGAVVLKQLHNESMDRIYWKQLQSAV